jgi:hypothetical protein
VDGVPVFLLHIDPVRHTVLFQFLCAFGSFDMIYQSQFIADSGNPTRTGTIVPL